MLLDIILGGLVMLTIVVTVWSLAVAFSSSTKPKVREHAIEVFCVAWKTAVAAVLLAIIRLYASGVLTVDPAIAS